MAYVVTVQSGKGGVGKTTIAVNLAVTLHEAGHRVLVIDADTGQQSALGWARTAADRGHSTPAVVAMEARALPAHLPTLASNYDVIVVDGPPRLDADPRGAVIVADVVLIPVTPGAFDVRALQATIGLVQEARAIRPSIRAAVILNRADPRTQLTIATRGAVESLGATLMASEIRSRVAFGEANTAGQGVVVHSPSSLASDEIRTLAGEVIALLGGTNGARETDRKRPAVAAQGKRAGSR